MKEQGGLRRFKNTDYLNLQTPRRGYTVADERKRVDPADANQITRAYLDSFLLEMRQIDADLPDTSMELYGHKFRTPIMMAALSHLNNCYPNGMVEMAKGAAAAGAVMWSGMGDEKELEEIVQTGAKTIKIIKPYADEEMLLKKIRHAEEIGCIAVGIDIDHAFGHKGGYDNVLGFPMTPKSQDRLHDFVKSTSLPFVIKGVLSVQDALKCAQIGVQGIVVSHHHGIMPYAVPPLYMLPDIVRAVGGKMPIFVDCGLESGFDAFKCLALGASAVSVGRKIMEYLHAEGAEGVRRGVEELTAQLSVAMARTCSHSLRSIDPAVLHRI